MLHRWELLVLGVFVGKEVVTPCYWDNQAGRMAVDQIATPHYSPTGSRRSQTQGHHLVWGIPAGSDKGFIKLEREKKYGK